MLLSSSWGSMAVNSSGHQVNRSWNDSSEYLSNIQYAAAARAANARTRQIVYRQRRRAFLSWASGVGGVVSVTS